MGTIGIALQQAMQAMQNPALDSAIKQIEKGNLLNGVMIAFMGAFFLLLGYVLVGQRKEIASVKNELVLIKGDMSQRDHEQSAVNLQLVSEATKAMTAMAERSLDLKSMAKAQLDMMGSLNINLAVMNETLKAIIKAIEAGDDSNEAPKVV